MATINRVLRPRILHCAALTLLQMALALAAHAHTGTARVFAPHHYYNTPDEAMADCKKHLAPIIKPGTSCKAGPGRHTITLEVGAGDYPYGGAIAYFHFPAYPCLEGSDFVSPGICSNLRVEKGYGSSSNSQRRGCPESGIVGNPCNPASGNKWQIDEDYRSGDGALLYRRSYNSLLNRASEHGHNWIVARRLEIQNDVRIQVRREDGSGEPFVRVADGDWSGDPDSLLTLIQDATGYTLLRPDGVTERYNVFGYLVSETNRAGQTTTYTYDTRYKLTAITSHSGSKLVFAHDSTGRVATLTGPDGKVIAYGYDAQNNLIRVDYPDGTAKLYHYENSAFPHHLTGISFVEADGTTTRYATYTYDSDGKAISTEHAGGQERFTLGYHSGTQTAVTDAAGTQEVMTFATNLGMRNLVSKVNLADGKSLEQVFDANNNLICRKDEEGRVTTYTYNATNQRTSVTEGLSGTCAAPAATSATRTTTYQYLSPTLDLPTQISSPSVAPGQTRTTTITYGDPSHPYLPTAITESGYTPSGNPVSRTVTLAYNAFGQVTSINGPRTDVNDVTTFAYYECTTGGACGQLQSATNAAGHTTTFDAYDANGRLTRMTDPNGLRTDYVYDPRGRVIEVTETPPGGAPRTTGYTYNAAGNVTSVTFPDGMVLTYTYNAAQLLTRVTNSLGNYIAYGYDQRGNRTSETTHDPSGNLVRQVTLAYDIRNRVAAINAGGSLTQQVRDAIGNLVAETDPNNNPATTHGYDALNRLLETIDRLNGVIAYGYDSADRLARLQVPNGATTEYRYDDLGNLLEEISPDRGTTTYTYDAAGNVRSVTDARGITVTYTYDALNRLTRIDYPNDPDVILIYDAGTNCAHGIGRLCRVEDESGVTEYGYDAFGNVTEQHKTERGVTYITRYTYDLQDRVSSITYPTGHVVSYTRDVIGRISAVTATVNGASQAIVIGRNYRADGLLLTQTYGNGLTETRNYDLRGLLTYQFLGAADTRLYTYDANGNLIQKQSLPEIATYTYDALDRLTGESATDGTINAYTYDPNGNRLSERKPNGKPRPYTYEPGSNRPSKRGNQDVVLDAAGYTLIDRDGNRTFTWNDAGRLKTATRGSHRGDYVYNYLGQRTQKARTTATGVIREFVYHYDIDGQLLAETRPNGRLVRLYVWADSEPIAQVQNRPALKTEELIYLHVDHLQTPRLATDPSQTVVWRFESEAFGVGKPERDPDADEANTNVRLRMPGQYFDGESGLFYNWNRYYDPTVGRYVSSDPIGLAGGLNAYVHLRANPLRYIDPRGLCAADDLGCQMAASPLIPPLYVPGAWIPPGPFGPVCGPAGTTLATWIPDGYFGADFTPICSTHDKCYDCSGRPRSECDDEFCIGLTKACQGYYRGRFGQQQCQRMARAYCKAVREEGSEYYQSR